ncbi:MAG: hypothetical protein J6X33_01475 [Clostridiales bacterium]|nr:hypothetical protein [Clostridiales bacterium]
MDNNELNLGQLDNVSGGEWTPGDWFDEERLFVVHQNLPEVECGVCHMTGFVQKVTFYEEGKEPDLSHYSYRCSSCSSSVGIC